MSRKQRGNSATYTLSFSVVVIAAFMRVHLQWTQYKALLHKYARSKKSG